MSHAWFTPELAAPAYDITHFQTIQSVVNGSQGKKRRKGAGTKQKRKAMDRCCPFLPGIPPTRHRIGLWVYTIVALPIFSFGLSTVATLPLDRQTMNAKITNTTSRNGLTGATW